MNEKRKLSLGVLLSTFVCVLLFAVTINVAYAYFSATATKEITINFHTLEVNVAETTSGALTQQLNGALPGDTINFSDIKISNTGSADAYTLVNLGVTIAKSNQATITYNEWYNLDGTKVDTSNFAINTAGATHLSSDETKNLNLNWTIPGSVDDNYQGSTITTKVTAHALQTYLPDARAYVNEALYASSFIIKNQNYYSTSNEIIQNSQSANITFSGENLIATSVVAGNWKYSRIIVNDIPAGTKVSLSASWVASGNNNGTICLYYYDTITGHLHDDNAIMRLSSSDTTITGTIPEKTSNSQVLALLFYSSGSETGEAGDTVTYSNVKLLNISKETDSEPLMKIQGKNIFDVYSAVDYQNSLVEEGIIDIAYKANIKTYNDKECMYIAAAGLYKKIDGVGNFYYFPVSCKENTQYTLSYTAYLTELVTGNGITQSTPVNGFAFVYSDGQKAYNNQYVLNTLDVQKLTITSLQNKTVVGIWMMYNYNKWTYFTDIQLEEGTTATEYQKYCEDTYNATTNTVTRNVKKLILDGSEAWDTSCSPTVLFNISEYGISLSQEVVLVLCSHVPSTNTSDVFGIKVANNGTCIGFTQCFEGFGVADLAEFKAYLKAQYDAGTPVTIWYQLATPQTEVIE